MFSTWYGYKDLIGKTSLNDKEFKIGNNQKYDRYQKGLPSMVYKCLDKKSERIETKTATEFHNKSIRSWLKTNNTIIHKIFETSSSFHVN